MRVLLVLAALVIMPAGVVHAGDLDAVLSYLKYDTNWIGAYAPGVWDCSNMAACLTWLLNDYETRIVEGEITLPMGGVELPNGTVMKHAPHVKVKVLVGDRWYWVEPTSLAVTVDAPEEYIAEREFKDYQEAFLYHVKRFGGRNATKEYGYDEKYMVDHVWVDNPRKGWPAWLR